MMAGATGQKKGETKTGKALCVSIHTFLQNPALQPLQQ
jgi:hypothetical protein